MTARHYLLLFILGLTVAVAVAAFQPAPGYMDAAYYYVGGLQLAGGEGFSEQILWNYLDDPAGLPHPSHAYWMPLASLVAALGMKLTGIADWSAARIGFLALGGLLPPLTAALAYSFTPRRETAILAGLLAVFSGFYLPFTPTTDTFVIYMLLGAAFFHASRPLLPRSPAPLLLGLLAGLMHLTRADGLLWLLVALIAVTSRQRSAASGQPSPVIRPLSSVLLGYLLIMSPWMLRNLSAFGTLLAPGGLRALWLTDYNQTFAYPASLLTFEHWWASGLTAILQARLWALGINLQRTLAEQGMIFLFPLILLGMWRLRRDPRLRLGGLAWLATFGAMTIVFPFAGARGGLFHSCAALQPLFWAVTPVGLDVLVERGVRLRGWDAKRSRLVFGGAIVVFAILLSAFVVSQRVIGADPDAPVWGRTAAAYTCLEAELRSLGAAPDDTVMVKNPPGYFAANRRPALVIPDGGVEARLAAAKRYHAGYI